jgi:hypothetical protein
LPEARILPAGAQGMTLMKQPEAAEAPEAAPVWGVEGRGKKDKHFIELLLITRGREPTIRLSFVELCPEGSPFHASKTFHNPYF